MFDFFYVIFAVMILMFFFVFFLTITRAFSEWRKNNNSPRLTVPATVVAKRTDYRHHHNNTTNMHSYTTSVHYVTFEFESGDRVEMSVDASEFGMLVEGDYGNLTFQGTRYLGFERF